MPLPPQLHSKYLGRFDELIEEGDRIIEVEVDSERFRQWQVKCGSLWQQIVPEGSIHWRRLQQIVGWAASDHAVQEILANLRAIKDDYEKGFLDNLPKLIRAEIAADYLAQAQLLVASGYHVPAAVLAGAVLEDALRKLCVENSIPTQTGRGGPWTIDPMNTELAKSDVYNAPKAAEIRGWASLRNHAAHGEVDQVDSGAVERMLAGVQSFVGDYLR